MYFQETRRVKWSIEKVSFRTLSSLEQNSRKYPYNEPYIFHYTCTNQLVTFVPIVYFQKTSIPSPWKVLSFFNPPFPRNFSFRGVSEDPPFHPEFQFTLYPHFRTPWKFQDVLYTCMENWQLKQLQSIMPFLMRPHRTIHWLAKCEHKRPETQV